MASGVTMEGSERTAERCSICWNLPMKIPIYQCNNGHILCRECEEKVERCPICRDSLDKEFKIRNLEAELLQPPLIFCDGTGCNEDFLNVEDLEEHLKFCELKKVGICKLLGIDEDCDAEFAPTDYELATIHLQEFHSYIASFWAPGSVYRDSMMEEDGKEGSLLAGLGTRPFLFCIRDERLFILKLVEDDMDRRIIPFVLAPQGKVNGMEVKLTFYFFTLSSSDDGDAEFENGPTSYVGPAVCASMDVDASGHLYAGSVVDRVKLHSFEVMADESDGSTTWSDNSSVSMSNYEEVIEDVEGVVGNVVEIPRRSLRISRSRSPSGERERRLWCLPNWFKCCSLSCVNKQ